jgi:hypothetical protein
VADAPAPSGGKESGRARLNERDQARGDLAAETDKLQKQDDRDAPKSLPDAQAVVQAPPPPPATAGVQAPAEGAGQAVMAEEVVTAETKRRAEKGAYAPARPAPGMVGLERPVGGARDAAPASPAATAPPQDAASADELRLKKEGEATPDQRQVAQTPEEARGQARAWNQLAAREGSGPRADEARVRAVEALVRAWQLSRDAGDLEQARRALRAYLARGDAAQKERGRALLQTLER